MKTNKKQTRKCELLIQGAVEENTRKNKVIQQTWIKRHFEEFIHIKRKLVHKILATFTILVPIYMMFSTGSTMNIMTEWELFTWQELGMGLNLFMNIIIIGIMYLYIWENPKGIFGEQNKR